MQIPTQITFRGIPHSDAIDTYIRERAAKLETFSTRIGHCRVAIEVPNHHSHARQYRVRIDLGVPRAELIVDHASDESAASADAYAAIDHAFDQIGRQLEDHVRRQRGDVKAHESSYAKARVAKLWSYEGYGFLETDESGEVYFHRNAVLHHAFDRLAIGSKVRFIEESGEKGPQASVVILAE